MTLKEKNIILKICQKVRYKWEEELSSLDLASFCCDVSEDLHYALLEHNIKTIIKEGECYDCFHVWLEYKGNIIDLTIKQFERFSRNKDLPKIFIKPISKCYQYKRTK